MEGCGSKDEQFISGEQRHWFHNSLNQFAK